MRSLSLLDQQLSGSIRELGVAYFGFWRWIAAQSIALYVLAALVMAYFSSLDLVSFLLCFGIAYLLANVLQALTRRPRPNYARLTGYRMLVHTYSFPSAHATLSASSAMALAILFQTSDLTWWTVVVALAVFLAGLIGLSRVVVGVHYLGDVLVGWGLGCVVAWVYLMLLIS